MERIPTLYTSYDTLKLVFGKYETDNFDDYKCQCEFDVPTPFGTVEIYDYKQGKQYCGDDEGIDLGDVTEFNLNMNSIKDEDLQACHEFVLGEIKKGEASRPQFNDIETMIIRLEKASDGEGYMYDIFMSQEAMDADNSIDGGQCTTNIDNALDMAVEQAKTFTKKG